jgi:hypothetical protein
MSLDALLLNQTAMAYRQAGAASGTLTKTTRGLEDPATGQATTTTQTASVLCMKDATSMRGLGFKYGEDLVKGGDIDISVPAKGLSFAPEPGCLLTTGGDTFRVISVRPTFGPGNTPVLYGLLVRQ